MWEGLARKLAGKDVVWYPSAGGDIHDVISYFNRLGGRYDTFHRRHRMEDEEIPLVFVHTDGGYSDFLHMEHFIDSEAGHFHLRDEHEMARVPAVSRGFCVFARPDDPEAGRCVEYVYEGFLHHRGYIRFSIITVAIENEQFAAEFLLPNQVDLVAVVHKCCGWGCGGGASCPGTWMRSVLRRLHVKYFITDPHGMVGVDGHFVGRLDYLHTVDFTPHDRWLEEGNRPGESEVSRIYPILKEPPYERVLFRLEGGGELWEQGSPHGFVRWFAVGGKPLHSDGLEYAPIVTGLADVLKFARTRKLCAKYYSPGDEDKAVYALLRKIGRECFCKWLESSPGDLNCLSDLNGLFRIISLADTTWGLKAHMRGVPLFDAYVDEADRREEARRLAEELRLREQEKAQAAAIERERLEKEAKQKELEERQLRHRQRCEKFAAMWKARKERFAEIALEEKLHIIATDAENLPEFYPLALDEIKMEELKEVAPEVLNEVAVRFAQLKRRDWCAFAQLVAKTIGERRGATPSRPENEE